MVEHDPFLSAVRKLVQIRSAASALEPVKCDHSARRRSRSRSDRSRGSCVLSLSLFAASLDRTMSARPASRIRIPEMVRSRAPASQSAKLRPNPR
jgi:hypothetical protein